MTTYKPSRQSFVAILGCTKIALANLVIFSLLLPALVSGQESKPIFNCAPEDCFLYFAWTGELKADPNGSTTEKWIAREEIRDCMTQLRTAVDGYLDENPMEPEFAGELVRELPWLMMRNSFAVYTGALDTKKETPISEGGMLVELGDREEWANRLIKEAVEYDLERDEPMLKEVTVDGKKAFELIGDVPGRRIQSIQFCVDDGYFFLAVGKDGLQKLLQRRNANPPAWLADLRSDLPVQRTVLLGHMHLKPAFDQLVEDADVRIPPAFRLNEVEGLSLAAGIEEDEMVTKALLRCPKKVSGILSVFDLPPLQNSDIALIPDGVTSASMAQFSAKRLWDLLQDAADDEINEFKKQFEEQSGLDFEQDVLDNFDDMAFSYQKLNMFNPTNGQMMGLKIKNPESFGEKLETINTAVEDTLDVFIDSSKSKDYTIYSLQGTVAVFWCQVDEYLVAGLDRKTITSFIRNKSKDRGKLINNDRFKNLVNAETSDGPVAVTHLDLATVIQSVLPLAQTFLGGQQPHPDFDFTIEDLPGVEALTGDVKPNISVIHRTEHGFLMTERHTYPGLSSVALSGVAVGMLLPAVQATRNAARRTQSMNNIRQLAIALHNYHDVHRSLPAAYTKDKGGKKLLSWRVHILPYLDEGALYEQFHLDEPWDSPHNKALLSKMPVVFDNPNMPQGGDEAGLTSYMAVSGEGGMLIPPQESSKDGQMVAGLDFADVRDGMANTIMLVEVNQANRIPWTKPGDFDPENGALSDRMAGTWPGLLTQAGMADGSVQSISSTIDLDTLMHMFHYKDGK